MHQGKNGSGRADAQRQGDNDRGRERGRLSQPAHYMADILQQSLYQRQPPLVPVLFLYRLHCPELQHGLASRLVRRQTGAKIVFNLKSEMFLNLRSQSLLIPFSSRPGGKPLNESP